MDFVIFHDEQKKSFAIGVVANREAAAFLSVLGRITLYNYNYTIVLTLGYFSLENLKDTEYYNYGSIFSESAGVCKFPFYDVLPTEKLIKWDLNKDDDSKNDLTDFIHHQQNSYKMESPAGKILRSIFCLSPEKVETIELVSLVTHLIKCKNNPELEEHFSAAFKMKFSVWWVAVSQKNQMKLWEQMPFLT